ncbi:MAG: glycoside hydrolase TIM-barrel-like domain-containing protein [Acuticoccus sp.]
MATLVLQAAGQAVGSFLGPVGALVGRAAGALGGYIIDQRLFGDNDTRTVGRIDELTVQTASEGNPIPKVYGRMRLAGTVVWSTDLVEHVSTSSSGKGGPEVDEFSYTASFAVAICEGPVARIGRVWADGEPLDLTAITMRTHFGTADQAPDDLIEATEGDAPAMRGTCYVVFENLPVGHFGNRLPQLTFEVIRPVGAVESMVRAVTLIPGATEFGYHPVEVKRSLGPGEADTDNRHLGVAPSDFDASLDELMALCPNLERVSLVVAWFGDDLRAGECRIEPCVEAHDRETDLAWRVAGLDRASAKLVSGDEGRPNYGGTPSDDAVFAAIEAIKARGLKVVFYPFVLMDVPAGNGLSDPYGGGEQAPFPWRGRITVSPAPGMEGSPDGTAAADADIAALVGTAAASDFAGAGGVVAYGGPAEWTLRRMMLHYAHLCAQAGGVDAFLVGSELRGLTTVRGAGGYPFVDALSTLVDDVRGVLGPATKISYAADWSEYFGHQPGNGDVTFHLDPLWANPNVDFIGIDNYWPLSDWRDGSHADLALAAQPHERAYLTGNIAGGEGFDWYYASDADRVAQVRSPISDGAHGKPWVFRYKDLKSWWENPHFDRVAGVEVATPTAWVPQSKPVWFTEVGCPAVDRGGNQPNVFYDPKSSESKLPYFSSGRRDDEMQRAYLEAMLSAYDPALSSDIDGFNPVSAAYGGRMIDPATVHVWTWDARPWPVFPHRTDVWSDGDNWERGHWVNGRLGGAPFADLVRTLFADWQLPVPEVASVPAVFDGFFVNRPQSLRAVLEPLLAAASVVGADTGTGIRFEGLTRWPGDVVSEEMLVDLGRDAPVLSETRDEIAALPVEQRLSYYDSGRTFQIASARYRPPEGSTRQIETIALPASLNDGLAAELAQVALNVRWGGRTTIGFALPMSEIAIMPGDIVTVRADGRDREAVVEEIEDLGHREVRVRTIDRAALSPTPTPGSPSPPRQPITLSPPYAFCLNLPLIDPEIPDSYPFVAAFARPWPGVMGVWRAFAGQPFSVARTIPAPSPIGFVVASPGPGPTSRWDDGGSLDVVLLSGTLSSRSAFSVLGGQNTIAVEAADGTWEVLQFRDATLVGERTYRLSTLLRGQLGTEAAVAAGVLPGAPMALIDPALPTLPTTNAQIGDAVTVRVGPQGQGVGGSNTTTFAFTPTGRAKMPLSPVHGRARAQGSGAVEISWIRRTRIDGDDWPDDGDVPLGESAEVYRVAILDGGVTVRTTDVAAPLYVYSLADQTADFGGAVGAVSVRITQLAPGFGPGIPYEVTLDVQQS